MEDALYFYIYTFRNIKVSKNAKSSFFDYVNLVKSKVCI